MERLLPEPYPITYETLIRAALEEDLGRAGDMTSDAVVPVTVQARGKVMLRQAGRIAGMGPAMSAFQLIDPGLSITADAVDGADLPADTLLAVVEGSARSILSAERTALNLLGRLSGIATGSRAAMEVVAGTKAQVVGTRKTTPGLRALEKYALRVGCGTNHRYGLDDAILIKDNHLVAAGGMATAVQRARNYAGHMVKIEVEVDTLEQLAEALTLPVDAVLLDNMSPAMLRRAVEMVDGRVITEASGGVTLQTIAEIAATGVDLISLGWLTHSVTNIDVGLDFETT